MSNDTETTEGAPPAEEKSRFTLPSAYTILFALIVIMAAADLDHPGRAVRPQRRRGTDPRHVP